MRTQNAKAWTKSEEARALTLRARGWTHEAIADELGRPSRAVCWKIGRMLRQFPCGACEFCDDCADGDCCELLADWCRIKIQAFAREVGWSRP